MKSEVKFVTLALVLYCLSIFTGCTMEPAAKNFLIESKQAKDARMQWWREARFGMFIHWGIYAVPAGKWNGKDVPGIGEWIMTRAQIPVEDYEPLAEKFNPVKFDADQWVRIAKDAGMKYIVITSKHHDGFGLWDSKVSDYDIIDRSPYKKDILKQLSKACKKYGIKFCFYHSIMDWHHPDYLPRRQWEKRSAEGADFQRYIAYMKAQLKELITEYDPAVLWFDGEWEDTWNHEEGLKLYNYVRSLKPDIIINNRVDKGRRGMQGMTRDDTFAGDFGTPEQEIPPAGLPGVDWESCMTMNDTWGFKTDDHNWKSDKVLIHNLIDIVSKGGNYLLNVGPTAEGLIPPSSVQRLQQMGKWMDVSGEALYATTPWDKAVYEDKLTPLIFTRVDATIDFDWGKGPPDEKIANNDFNITWSGVVVPKFSEKYSFHTLSDDGVRLWIDGKKIIDNWTEHSATEDTGTLELKAGEEYSLKIQYYENSGDAVAKLFWSSPSQPKQIVPADALGEGLLGIYRSISKKPRELFFTAKGNAVYAITTHWPETQLSFDTPKPSADTIVTLLGRDGNLKWKYNDGKIHIDVSDINSASLPCEHAWVLKITPM